MLTISCFVIVLQNLGYFPTGSRTVCEEAVVHYTVELYRYGGSHIVPLPAGDRQATSWRCVCRHWRFWSIWASNSSGTKTDISCLHIYNCIAFVILSERERLSIWMRLQLRCNWEIIVNHCRVPTELVHVACNPGLLLVWVNGIWMCRSLGYWIKSISKLQRHRYNRYNRHE